MCKDVNRRHTQRPGRGLHDFISAAQSSATAETRASQAISSAAAATARVCKEYADGARDMQQFLRAVGHTIRFH